MAILRRAPTDITNMTFTKLTHEHSNMLEGLCEELMEVPFTCFEYRLLETQNYFADKFGFEPSMETVKKYYLDNSFMHVCEKDFLS